MKSGSYLRVKQLVGDILEASAEQRQLAFERLATEDAEVRVEVEALLAEEVDLDFLAQPPQVDAEIVEENLVGQRVGGRLRIDRLIARGGMGAVYEGVDELLSRSVAIKVVRSGLQMSERQRDQFLNEARSLSSLNHPNVCALHDYISGDERDLLVLELIDGETLREAHDGGRLGRPLDVLRQIADGLVAAHERGVAHRDLKPDNVMITRDGTVKILDFGLARADRAVLAGAETAHDQSVGGSTVVGTHLAGTPGYMAPEQARGERSTMASDLFAFGVLMSELLTGRSPFPNASSHDELIESTRKTRLDLPENLPRAERRLLTDLLAPDPTTRPTARETRSRLEAISRRGRRRLWAVGTLFLSGAVLTAAVKYTTDLQRSESEATAARQEAEDLIGFMLGELNQGLTEVGRLDLLELVAQRALDYYGELDDAEMARDRGAAALALVQIGNVLNDRGDQTAAQAAFEPALGALDRLSLAAPEDEMLLYRAGFAHQSLAESTKLSGNWPLAVRSLERSIAIGRRLTEGLEPGTGPEEVPTAQQRWKLLLRSTYLQADVFNRSNRPEEASALLAALTPVAVAAAAVDDGLKTDLSDIRYKSCDVFHELARVDLVVSACEGTLALDRELYAAEPDRFIYLANVADSLMRTHDAYRLVGEPERGYRLIQEGQKLAELALERDPENANTVNNLANLLWRKGRTELDLGLEDDGRLSLERSLELSSSVVADNEEVVFLHSHFMALILLRQIERARVVAVELLDRDFGRREFIELCQRYGFRASTEARS